MIRAAGLEGASGEQKLALLDELRQAERRAVSSRVAAVIAHLIGTPLHVIAGRASLIRSAPNEPGVEENARRIEEQVERLAKRIRGLIDYLTTPEDAAAEDTGASVLARALALYEPIGEERGVHLRLVGEPPPPGNVEGTSALMVLTSLLSLATRIAPNGETCELGVMSADARFVFELTIPGLELPVGRLDSLEPPEHLPREKSEEMQVLSVCYAIARRSGGNLEVVAATSGRATIRYSVPCLA